MIIEDTLRKIKNNYPLIWSAVEKVNAFAVKIVWGKLIRELDLFIENHTAPEGFNYHLIDNSNCDACIDFLLSLDDGERRFFRPFKYSKDNIARVINSCGFRCYAMLRSDSVVGFFFLRLLVDKRAYLGFVVHRNYRGMGLGNSMIATLAEACEQFSIELFSTVSDYNTASVKSHLRNGFTRIREMRDNYFLYRLQRRERKLT